MAARDALHAALAEQRARIGRDIHDGPLQSLTGVSLRLVAVHRLFETAPAQALAMLDESEQLLADEIRELRELVLELREEAEIDASGMLFEAQVNRLADRTRRVWGLNTLVGMALAHEPPAPLCRALRSLLQEALSNAVRHGRATAAEIWITDADGDIVVDVSQVGGGFAFEGTMDHDELIASRRGPVSLKARVRDLGGRLSITSARDGAFVHIAIPMATP